MNPKPASPMQRATASGARSILAPSASSRAADPDRLAAQRVAGFATPAAGPRGDQRRGGRPVDRRAPAAGPGRVEQIVAVAADRGRELAHRARQALDLFLGLPLRAQ